MRSVVESGRAAAVVVRAGGRFGVHVGERRFGGGWRFGGSSVTVSSGSGVAWRGVAWRGAAEDRDRKFCQFAAPRQASVCAETWSSHHRAEEAERNAGQERENRKTLQLLPPTTTR